MLQALLEQLDFVLSLELSLFVRCLCICKLVSSLLQLPAEIGDFIFKLPLEFVVIPLLTRHVNIDEVLLLLKLVCGFSNTLLQLLDLLLELLDEVPVFFLLHPKSIDHA